MNICARIEDLGSSPLPLPPLQKGKAGPKKIESNEY